VAGLLAHLLAELRGPALALLTLLADLLGLLADLLLAALDPLLALDPLPGLLADLLLAALADLLGLLADLLLAALDPLLALQSPLADLLLAAQLLALDALLAAGGRLPRGVGALRRAVGLLAARQELPRLRVTRLVAGLLAHLLAELRGPALALLTLLAP
jgi:hypothetical protein